MASPLFDQGEGGRSREGGVPVSGVQWIERVQGCCAGARCEQQPPGHLRADVMSWQIQP